MVEVRVISRVTLFALISCAMALALAYFSASPALAQTWPTRPVRIVVPYSPGGGIDTVARMLAQKLAEQLGTSFVVENRAGAAGILGAELVARSVPDGYTLLASSTEFAINPAVRAKLPYDPLRDFSHISQLASVQFILGCHPSVPASNVKDVIALAAARPTQLTYGSSGTGGGPHLAGELLQSMARIRWVHVPYKGAAPAALAAMSGEIDFVFGATIGLLENVRNHKLRALGVTGATRFSQLPDVPTIAESGLPGYSATGWYGYYAPAGISQDLLRRLYGDATRALGATDVREKLARSGNEYVMSAPQQFTAFLRAEIAKWGRLVKEANIRIE